MNKNIVAFLLSAMLITSCHGQESFIKDQSVKVMIESGDGYFVNEPYQMVEKGEDVTFKVELVNLSTFVSASYPNYEIVNATRHTFDLVLKNVWYSSVVSLNVSPEPGITYFGTSDATSDRYQIVKKAQVHSHLKENAINAYDIYTKEGYVPLGWNTKEDFTGEFVSFGSRIPFNNRRLYLQWEKESDPELFLWQDDNDEITIFSYLGHEEKVVIPQKINGKKVTALSPNALVHEELKTLILPKTIKKLHFQSIAAPNIEEIYLCDNIEEISDLSFCYQPKTVHINAVIPPNFSGSYYDTFPDKIDYLESVKDEKKIILFSGSSTRYGYDSEMIDAAYPEYKTVNMGVFAYVNIEPQLDVITAFTKKGDILLSSPEFDNHCLQFQFAATNEFSWQLFPFFESNYDLLKYININKYQSFFTAFYNFLEEKKTMSIGDYSTSPKHYDDDGTYYAFDTYNIQGDLILPREGHPRDEWISQPLDEYRLETTIKPELITCLDELYKKLLAKELNVMFTFFPKNRNCIKNTTPSDIERIEECLRNMLSVPVISNWRDSILPGTDFYLIDNHLSTQAAKERTQRIINEMYWYI